MGNSVASLPVGDRRALSAPVDLNPPIRIWISSAWGRVIKSKWMERKDRYNSPNLAIAGIRAARWHTPSRVQIVGVC
jgi:hypothetical protein